MGEREGGIGKRRRIGEEVMGRMVKRSEEGKDGRMK